uniref:E3 ubiquitin-protein ligase RNF220 middle domain-containing protein n=1 Tax=Sus scrofa TaxID=9823 RepID=A0A8D1NY05_PIG
MKRRKQDEGQREGSCMAEEDAVDIEHENSNRFEEYEWCGQKRIRATTLLEGGFRGSGFVMCSGKENPDSDADLDVDGDDTLEYGKPQYTEADVIPCTGEEPGEAKEREALRGAVLNGGPPSTRITPEFSKWASDEMPSTSNGESSKQEAMQKTCKNSDIEKITEDSAVTTFEALKARVRELERQLSRGDRYKCLICMDSYSMPLTSIQCWHVHCEECWLRTLVKWHGGREWVAVWGPVPMSVRRLQPAWGEAKGRGTRSVEHSRKQDIRPPSHCPLSPPTFITLVPPVGAPPAPFPRAPTPEGPAREGAGWGPAGPGPRPWPLPLPFLSSFCSCSCSSLRSSH